MSQPFPCYIKPDYYPILYGADSGDTEFFSIDYSPTTGNIIVGGTSNSIDIVDFYQPILILFGPNGDLLWSRRLEF